MKITSLEELKQFAEGEIIEFPGFTDDKPFTARIKRYSMIGLATSGKIPNPLIVHAEKIFDNARAQMKGEKKLSKKEKNEIEALETLLLHESLLEPTYQQIIDLKIDLSPLQKALIIEASQGETSRLATFRNLATDIESFKHGERVQSTSKPNTED